MDIDYLNTPLLSNNRPTIRQGDEGDAVRELQILLINFGYNPGSTSGIFGPITNTAVRAFQTDQNLEVTGIVGPITWNTLLNMNPGPIIKRELRGIILDSGHGGNDSGAVHNGILEKDYTLKISLYMAEKLREEGILVSLTRITDETLALTGRINRINNFFGGPNRDIIMISNHLNAATNTSANGAEVIYALRNTPELAQNILDGIVSSGIGRRRVFQRALDTNPNQDHFVVIRETNPSQSLIVEYGFISNINDANNIRDNWQSLTDGAINGLLEYLRKYYLIENAENIYIVRSGDTLFSIARTFNTTIDELIRLNNLTSNNLSIGQRLIINEKVNELINTFQYIVVAGDTLFNLANRFGTTAEEIMQINNLTSSALKIDQKLLIPGALLPGLTTYTVISGDTLWSIANRFNVTVNQLMRINNLTGPILSVGQKLLIPKGIEPELITYIVQGDNLELIADKFNSTIQEIKTLNNLTTETLYIGQELLIRNIKKTH